MTPYNLIPSKDINREFNEGIDIHDEISLWEEVWEYLSKGWVSTSEFHDIIVKKVKNHIEKIKASSKMDK